MNVVRLPFGSPCGSSVCRGRRARTLGFTIDPEVVASIAESASTVAQTTSNIVQQVQEAKASRPYRSTTKKKAPPPPPPKPRSAPKPAYPSWAPAAAAFVGVLAVGLLLKRRGPAAPEVRYLYAPRPA